MPPDPHSNSVRKIGPVPLPNLPSATDLAGCLRSIHNIILFLAIFTKCNNSITSNVSKLSTSYFSIISTEAVTTHSTPSIVDTDF